MDLLADELTGLGVRRCAAALCAFRAFDGGFLGHGALLQCRGLRRTARAAPAFNSPAAEALPHLDGLAVSKDVVLGMLRGSGAGMVGKDAQERPHREALEV